MSLLILNTHRILIVQSLASWPLITWYMTRLLDGSDEPWGIISLLTLLTFAICRMRQSNSAPDNNVANSTLSPSALLISSSLLVFSAIAGLPPLPRVLLCIIAIYPAVSLIVAGRRFNVAVLGLLLLSLPIIASLQFYGGFPIRALTAHLVSFLTDISGYDTTVSGTAIAWRGDLVVVDAPCAGIKMLWAGIFLNFTLSLIYRLSNLSTILAHWGAISIIFIGNVIRATLLFFTETQIVNLGQTLTPKAHEAIGIVVFGFVTVAITLMVRTMPKMAKQSKQESTSSLQYRTRPLLANNLRRKQEARKSNFSVDWGFNWFILTVHILIAFAPIVSSDNVSTDVSLSSQIDFANFEATDFLSTTDLRPIALSSKERRFSKSFPGTIRRYQDGSRELLFRHVTKPTRMLHPSRHCFQGMGYTITPRPLENRNNRIWSCSSVYKEGQAFKVCELIIDQSGKWWSDVSSWYWSSILGNTQGPWLATTTIERI